MRDIRTSEPKQGVLAVLLNATKHVIFRQENIYDQFFAHAAHCNHSPAGNSIEWIRISDMIKKVHNLAADLQHCDNWACSILRPQIN